MRRFLTVLSVVFCSLVLQLAGCQKEKPVDTSQVDRIANDILVAISIGQADKVYDTYFTPQYRKTMSRKVWQELVKAYSEKLGPVVSIKRTRTSTFSIDGDVGGSFGYTVTWEKGSGTADLKMALGEKWLLVHILIDSKVFATDAPVESTP